MGNRPFTLIAAIIFALMALVHLLRLFMRFQVVVGTHPLAMWMSIVAIAITAVLSWGLFKESRR
ncbi:MAG TPA: hypothetical protein VFP53_02720 [Sphingomicrobium sp.]|nr:hypothetical protein [Sphingomicrobium sp.]